MSNLLCFSYGRDLSKNTSTYPITVSDVKAHSKYFEDNPSETIHDTNIELIKIPDAIFDWENKTKFYLLDQTRLAYLDTKYILAKIYTTIENGIPLNALNVRSVDFVKYLEPLEMVDTLLTVEKHYFTVESIRKSMAFNLQPKELKYLELYPTQNNLKIQYKAGYLNNDFTNLPSDIKRCLARVAAINFDVERGYCDRHYTEFYKEIYNEFGLICSY